MQRTNVSRIAMLMLAIMFFMSAWAQKLRTIDKNGQPIPHVSVMTTDAKLIGVTDIYGVIADVKGADTISVRHVAYKPKLYKVNTKIDSIILEDADFELPEIVVKDKPYVYVQTYYRMYFYTDKMDMGMVYYRAGFTDNVIDRSKKKLSASTTHASKARFGIIKASINMLVGGLINRSSHLPMNKIEDNIMNRQSPKLTIIQDGPDKKRICDSRGTVGYIIDGKNQRRIIWDPGQMRRDKVAESGNAKKMAKLEKKDAKMKNLQNSCFIIYHIDEDGNYLPEDFVMREDTESYDEVQKDGSVVHEAIGTQVFSIKRAYVDKEELKQLKKENKMKMTYQNIRQFEKAHKIPDLPANLQQKLNELWKVDTGLTETDLHSSSEENFEIDDDTHKDILK